MAGRAENQKSNCYLKEQEKYHPDARNIATCAVGRSSRG